jgi:hypothetical protein
MKKSSSSLEISQSRVIISSASKASDPIDFLSPMKRQLGSIEPQTKVKRNDLDQSFDNSFSSNISNTNNDLDQSLPQNKLEKIRNNKLARNNKMRDSILNESVSPGPKALSNMEKNIELYFETINLIKIFYHFG